jgi:hypothetical protein
VRSPLNLLDPGSSIAGRSTWIPTLGIHLMSLSRRHSVFSLTSQTALQSDFGDSIGKSVYELKTLSIVLLRTFLQSSSQRFDCCLDHVGAVSTSSGAQYSSLRQSTLYSLLLCRHHLKWRLLHHHPRPRTAVLSLHPQKARKPVRRAVQPLYKTEQSLHLQYGPLYLLLHPEKSLHPPQTMGAHTAVIIRT